MDQQERATFLLRFAESYGRWLKGKQNERRSQTE